MALPLSLKSIQPYIKVANDLRKKHKVVAYFCDFHAMQTGMTIDKSSPEAKTFLLNLMSSLEKQKKILVEDSETAEQVSSDLVGQNLIEEQARKLFAWSDMKDKNAEFGKNVVKAFYTAAILFDVAEAVGGENSLDDESTHQRKYARWKATYINNCLKSGQEPIPGPVGGLEDDLEAELNMALRDGEGSSASHPTPQQPQVPPAQPPMPATRAKVLPTQPEPTSIVAPSDTPPAAEGSGQEWPQEVFDNAYKYCKYALNAIEYQDVQPAIDNLSKCMHILRTGKSQ